MNYGILRSLHIHPPTFRLHHDSASHKKLSKLVILLSICPKGLTGLGRFDSINSYLLASSYGFGYMSYFSEPLFTVLHCKTCTKINIHTHTRKLSARSIHSCLLQEVSGSDFKEAMPDHGTAAYG